MAGVAFVATQDQRADRTRGHHGLRARPRARRRRPRPFRKKPKKLEPAVKRGKVYVEVYNNSGITGLAGRIGQQASTAGWQVVGSDNWYGTIPASTVYFPPRLRDAAKVLALDLGIHRVQPAIDPMRLDRLTVILTADAA